MLIINFVEIMLLLTIMIKIVFILIIIVLIIIMISVTSKPVYNGPDQYEYNGQPVYNDQCQTTSQNSSLYSLLINSSH